MIGLIEMAVARARVCFFGDGFGNGSQRVYMRISGGNWGGGIGVWFSVIFNSLFAGFWRV